MSTRSTFTEQFWTSKLGNKYPKHEIERNHDRTMKELKKLRCSGLNSKCADCGQDGTMWSSVNLGIFLCLRCGSLHRALGTHISIPKGCTGTYFWGTDELERMREIGNEKSNSIYGGGAERPPIEALDSVWLEYIRNKYEKKAYTAGAASSTSIRHVDSTAVKTNNTSSPSGGDKVVDLLDNNSSLSKTSTNSTDDFFSEFGF